MLTSLQPEVVKTPHSVRASGAKPLHFVHFMPSFNPGGAQVRVADLMNDFGARCRHTVFAFRGGFEMRERVLPEVEVDCKTLTMSGGGVERIRGLMKLLRELKPDLVLTYNWGAIEAAIAALLNRAAPLVHGEDGFGPEEVQGQIRRRVWTRRIVLRHAAALVAPSETLSKIMLQNWKLPARVVQYIPNGVDVDFFQPKPRSLADRKEVVVSTVGQLRPEKQQGLLIQACARVRSTVPVRLLIAGDGPERGRLERTAEEVGFRHQVTFLGHTHDVLPILQQSDIFALSSMTEQLPISVLEAMACGLPVVSTAVGDVKTMVSEVNRPYICGVEQYQDTLTKLIGDAALRESLGAANRERCLDAYSRTEMLRRYRRLYSEVTGSQQLQD
jgi:glycosyltransferase involved in cell wall biosynthesis